MSLSLYKVSIRRGPSLPSPPRQESLDRASGNTKSRAPSCPAPPRFSTTRIPISHANRPTHLPRIPSFGLLRKHFLLLNESARDPGTPGITTVTSWASICDFSSRTRQVPACRRRLLLCPDSPDRLTLFALSRPFGGATLATVLLALCTRDNHNHNHNHLLPPHPHRLLTSRRSPPLQLHPIRLHNLRRPTPS